MVLTITLSRFQEIQNFDLGKNLTLNPIRHGNCHVQSYEILTHGK